MAISVSGRSDVQVNQVNTTKPAFNPSGRAKVLGGKFMARTCIFFSNPLSREFLGDTSMKAASNYMKELSYTNHDKVNLLTYCKDYKDKIQFGGREILKAGVDRYFKDQSGFSLLWWKRHYRNCVVQEVIKDLKNEYREMVKNDYLGMVKKDYSEALAKVNGFLSAVTIQEEDVFRILENSKQAPNKHPQERNELEKELKFGLRPLGERSEKFTTKLTELAEETIALRTNFERLDENDRSFKDKVKKIWQGICAIGKKVDLLCDEIKYDEQALFRLRGQRFECYTAIVTLAYGKKPEYQKYSSTEENARRRAAESRFQEVSQIILGVIPKNIKARDSGVVALELILGLKQDVVTAVKGD